MEKEPAPPIPPGTFGEPIATILLPDAVARGGTDRYCRPAPTPLWAIFQDFSALDNTRGDGHYPFLDWMPIGEGRQQRQKRSQREEHDAGDHRHVSAGHGRKVVSNQKSAIKQWLRVKCYRLLSQ
jgi:hypothetical protein